MLPPAISKRKDKNMKDPLHSLSARVNPTLEQMQKEIRGYRAFVKGHMLAIGLSWESVSLHQGELPVSTISLGL